VIIISLPQEIPALAGRSLPAGHSARNNPPASSLDYYFFFILVLCVSLYLIILIVRQFVSRTHKSAARGEIKKSC
jgi:hypothetical protein